VYYDWRVWAGSVQGCRSVTAPRALAAFTALAAPLLRCVSRAPRSTAPPRIGQARRAAAAAEAARQKQQQRRRLQAPLRPRPRPAAAPRAVKARPPPLLRAQRQRVHGEPGRPAAGWDVQRCGEEAAGGAAAGRVAEPVEGQLAKGAGPRRR